jgi:hypothetical protein
MKNFIQGGKKAIKTKEEFRSGEKYPERKFFEGKNEKKTDGDFGPRLFTQLIESHVPAIR